MRSSAPSPCKSCSRARPAHPDGYELAVVSTDLAATPAELVERYSHRWSVEVCFEESRQVMGVGQARNRTPAAVERTVPFGLVCLSLVVCWYAQHGQPAAEVAARRTRAPWYHTKRAVSLADMLTALRRELLTAQFLSSRLVTPTLEQLPQAHSPGRGSSVNRESQATMRPQGRSGAWRTTTCW